MKIIETQPPSYTLCHPQIINQMKIIETQPPSYTLLVSPSDYKSASDLYFNENYRNTIIQMIHCNFIKYFTIIHTLCHLNAPR